MGQKGKKTRPAAKIGRENLATQKKKEMEEQTAKESESESEFESESDSNSESGSESESDEQSSSGDDSASNSCSDDEDTKSKDNNSKGFTDENSSWLKPKSNEPTTTTTTKKQQLLDSDDCDSDSDATNDSNSNSSSDSDDELDIEKESKLLDQQLLIEQAEAETELRRTISQQTATFHLPTTDELTNEHDGTRVVPPSELRERIDEILTVLADFKNGREANRSRCEYIDQLSSDMSELFGYLPELVEYFLTMFNPSETLEFLEASDSPRPLVIRANTLKTRRKDLAASLLKRGVTLDPLANWSKVGLKITASPIPIGATPEYLSGQYMLQSAASFCPCLALNPTPGKEVVLDLSSAPGGKTTYLAQLMRNTGTIVANDLKPERQKATIANVHRLGVRNVITCCYDGRKLGKLWKNRFTKILLDAPCSGLGVISRDPSVKLQRTIQDIDRCSVLQKELLLSAIDSLNAKAKGGGIMVYSTCSVSVKENEEVVDYLLNNRDVKLLDPGLDFGKPGFTRYQQKRFHPSIAKTRRFYPHVHNMDGFYVAKILKLSDRRPSDAVVEEEDASKVVDSEEGKSKIDGEIDNEGEGDEKKEKSTEIDWAKRVRKQVARTKDNKHSCKRGSDAVTPGNERRKGGNDETSTGDNRKKEERLSKKSKVANTPVFAKNNAKNKRKNSTNAKVNKPRRSKQDLDSM